MELLKGKNVLIVLNYLDKEKQLKKEEGLGLEKKDKVQQEG